MITILDKDGQGGRTSCVLSESTLRRTLKHSRSQKGAPVAGSILEAGGPGAGAGGVPAKGKKIDRMRERWRKDWCRGEARNQRTVVDYARGP